jgi:hypothetical protein
VLQSAVLPRSHLLPEAPLLREGLRLLRRSGLLCGPEVLRRSQLLRLLREGLLLQSALQAGSLLPSDLLRHGWLLRVLPACGLCPGLLQMIS